MPRQKKSLVSSCPTNRDENISHSQSGKYVRWLKNGEKQILKH